VTPGASEQASRRPGPLWWALGLLACLLAGVLTGVAWELLAPLPRLQVVGDRVLSPDVEQETAVAADGWFAVCAAVAGVLAAVAAFARVRAAHMAVLAGLTLGGLAAAIVAWRVGVALGPGSVQEEAAGLADGDIFNGPLRLSAHGVLFTWPLTSAIMFFALAAGLDPRRSGPTSQPGPALPETSSASSGGRFATTVLRPGYSIEEVDRFFARLERGEVTAEDRGRVRFTSTWFRRGYAEEQVDAALHGVRST
jgi:DivIVA domain-containing protein